MVGLIMGFSAMAQRGNHTVAGYVYDEQTGERLLFANVGLMREVDTVFVCGATTDADGNFMIKNVEKGNYLLQVSYVGYQAVVEPWRVVGDTLGVAIGLRSGTTLDAVEVVAARPLYAMDGEKNMYNAKDDPSVQNGTASDALQNAPGVEVDAEGNITLRGVAGVEIWINDHPSHMNEEALKQYIKQLPANAIDRIEVITNPSARYSASGGVINIVTNQVVTRNELLCVGVRARTSPSVSPWLSYVYANDRFDVNVYVGADYSHHHTYGNGTATLFTTNGDTSRHQSHTDTATSHNVGGYVGVNLNWNISEQTHLTTWLGAYPFLGQSHSTVDLDYYEYYPWRDLGYRYTHDNNDGLFYGGYGGAWLEHRFDSTGRKLSLSLSSNTSNNGGTAPSVFEYHNPLLPEHHRQEESETHNASIGLTLDYTHPMKHDWEVAAGLSTSYGWGSDRARLDTLGVGHYDVVALRSHDGIEYGTDLASYATLQKRWGGFTAKVGLRGEWGWMGSEWQHEGVGDRTVSDTFFFVPVPSVHISYQTKTFTSYSLSYTRRYANPGKSQLNPFRRYEDYGYTTGNPALRFTYTHNVEASFSKYFNGFGLVGMNAYCRVNTDEIATMSHAGYDGLYFPATQLVDYSRPENIGSSHTEGIEANITYRPTAMLNVRLNATMSNYGYTYQGFSDSRLAWSVRLNVWAKLWNWLEVFANAHYASPRLGLYSLSVANKGVDFGVSSDLFDRRLSLYLNINDLFGMAEWGENSTAPTYRTTGSQQYDSRFVSLGLTWRLGKMELEGKARQGAADSNTPQM